MDLRASLKMHCLRNSNFTGCCFYKTGIPYALQISYLPSSSFSSCQRRLSKRHGFAATKKLHAVEAPLIPPALFRVVLLQCFLTLMLIFTPLKSVYATDILKVRYPFIQHPYYSKRDVYFISLLRIALERSGETYELIPVKFSEYSEKRSKLLIQSGQYDVHWLNTTEANEQALLAVPVPLYKGAIGWRVFFIRPEMQAAFSKVESVEDLKHFVLVQGHDWADVPILLNAGLSVERTSNRGSLFNMVILNRAHAFPRSIVEIVAEHQNDINAKDLVIEQSLLLQYPAAYYYFVQKDNTRLKQSLYRGLKRSLEDGSFDQLFFDTFGDQIDKLNIESRRVLSIDNPKLETTDDPMWFSQEWLKNQKKLP